MRSDRSCERRMEELSDRADRTGLTQYTCFLSPAEQMQAQISARKKKCEVFFWGGFPDAERKIAAFCAEGAELEWPLCAVRFTWNERFGTIAHRDLLGAMMSLGIERERYGDIIVAQGCAYAAMHRGVAEFVAGAIETVGRAAVSSSVENEMPMGLSANGEEVRLVVSSLRLDALISAAWKLSRGCAQEVIASGKAQVDHCPELRPDRAVAENALVSVRGKGRFRLMETVGKTKKDRVCVLITRY